MATNGFDIEAAIGRLEQYRDGAEQLVSRVAADVCAAADMLGRTLQKRQDLAATAQIARGACTTIVGGGAVTDEQAEALKLGAGDVFNALQEKLIADDARQEAGTSADSDEPADAQQLSRNYRFASKRRRESAKFARTAAQLTAPTERDQHSAWLAGQIRENAKAIALREGGGGARYRREVERLIDEADVTHMPRVALLGSTTPHRPIRDTNF